MTRQPATMSPGRGAQRLPEQAADVVGHEERRDGDRGDVGEHLRPRGEERPELVERAPREARRAAGLRVHRRRLGVGGRGAEEEEPRDDEDDRGQAQRERGDEAERVVDRRPDVAVGRREQRVGPEHPFKALQSASCHAVAILGAGTRSTSSARSSSAARPGRPWTARTTGRRGVPARSPRPWRATAASRSSPNMPPAPRASVTPSV